MTTEKSTHPIQDLKYLAELTVYGFVRENCRNKANDGTSWPDDISKLCFSMYFIVIDAWNRELPHPEMKIDSEQNTITSPTEGPPAFIEAVGTIQIKKGDIKTWKFKIAPSANLGVIDCEKYMKLRSMRNISDRVQDHIQWSAKVKPVYNMSFLYSTMRSNFEIICDDNGISMTLGMTGEKYATLSFKSYVPEEYRVKNNHGVVFDDIHIDKEYYMIALTMQPSSFVKLLEES